MGVTGPVVWMVAASAAGVLAGALIAPAHLVPVALGAAGPLAGAVVSWIVVARLFARAPERVSGAMVKLFGAKMVFFAAFVIAAARLLPDALVAFAVSLAGQYIMLHLMDAYFLHRLFGAPARPGAQREGGADPRLRAD